VKPITLGIKCPKCKEGEILQRRSGKSKRIFYGCTRYPDCDFLVNFEPVIQTCTNCNNEYLLKKETKKDGKFLECPQCKTKFELELKPVAAEE
jgi:DNA topoisomerase-1